MRRLRRQRGFTLMELLMTLAITTIGLIGLLSMHLSIARGNDGASRTAEAQQVGTLTLESLRAARITDMMQALTGSSLSVPPVTTTMPTVTGRNGVTYARTATVTALNSASTSLWRLRVVVTWQEDGAAAGTQGGIFDHSMAVEVIRTVEEAL